jgi:hypothetical protein
MAWVQRPGTTVTIYFPHAVILSKRSPCRKFPSAMPPGSGIILVVEDDDAVRKMRWSADIMQNKTVLSRSAC